MQRGRRLVRLLGVDQVSYPDDEPSVVVQIWGAHEAIPQEAAAVIEEVIGPFDVLVMEN